MIAIVNGRIFTAEEDEVLEGGSILIKDGRIEEVGYDLYIPEGTECIDAEGACVYPGFVDAHSHIGMVEEAMGWEGEDENERTGALQPELRAIDGVNPMDPHFTAALAAGVTTVATGPGSANVVGGTFLAMKTYGRRVDDMVIKDPVAMKVAFGENPKRVYGKTRDGAPMTRMGIAAALRKLLTEAQSYREKRIRTVGKAPVDFRLEAMVPVLDGEIPLKVHAHRADDIFTAIRIAEEFHLSLTLDHCTEGHLISRELKDAGYPCIIGPSFGFKTKVELREKSFATTVALAREGIPFAIMTDCPVIPEDQLPLCAAFGVKAGLDPYEALNAITINPAKILGIHRQVGSIARGKDGDLSIWDGNFLEDFYAKPLYTIVEGKVVFKR